MNDITRSSQFTANSLEIYDILHFKIFQHFSGFSVFVVLVLNLYLISSLRGPI